MPEQDFDFDNWEVENGIPAWQQTRIVADIDQALADAEPHQVDELLDLRLRLTNIPVR